MYEIKSMVCGRMTKFFLILSGLLGVVKARSAEDYIFKKVEQCSPSSAVEQA